MEHDSLLRLQQHAGLPTANREVPADTWAEYFLRLARGGSPLGLATITDDIIQCLDELNRSVNPSPDEVRSRRQVPDALVYALSGIVGLGLEAALSPKADRNVLITLWRIQSAWDALLAGDIDDLRQHVFLEEQARIPLRTELEP